ncbi:fibronectin type III domain-containing protein [Paenibacillus larvae]
MKKIVCVAIAIFMSLCFAVIARAENEILLTKPFGTDKLWDGSRATGIALWQGQRLRAKLQKPKNITSYFLSGGSKENTINFYDANLKILKSFKMDNRQKEYKFASPVKGVTYVEIVGGKYPYDMIYEFNVASDSAFKPPAPKISGKSGIGEITLTWESIPGALGYIIYRDGNVARTNFANNTTYTVFIQPDEKHTYEVTTLNSDGVESDKSNKIELFSWEKETKPILTVKQKDGKIDVSWEIGKAGGTYKLSRNGRTIYEGSEKTYQDDGSRLLGNKTCVYLLSGVDKYGRKIYSDPVTIRTEPDIPFNLSATPSDDSVTLTYDAVEDSDIEGYNVYVNGIKHNAKLVKDKSYKVEALSNGRKYSFTVTAVYKDGTESQQSKSIRAAPKAPPPKPQPGTGLILGPDTQWGFDTEDILKSGAYVLASLALFVLIPLAIMYSRKLIDLIRKATKS